MTEPITPKDSERANIEKEYKTSSSNHDTLASPISCHEEDSDYRNGVMPIPPNDTSSLIDDTLASPIRCHEADSDYRNDVVPIPQSDTSSSNDETFTTTISCHETDSDFRIFSPSDLSKLNENNTKERTSQYKETSDTNVDADDAPCFAPVFQALLIHLQILFDIFAIQWIKQNQYSIVSFSVRKSHVVKTISRGTRQQMFQISDIDDWMTKHTRWTNTFWPFLHFYVSDTIESSVYPVLFTEEDVPYDDNQNVMEQTGRLIEPESIHSTFETIPFQVSRSGSLAHTCRLPPLENAGIYKRAEDYTDERTNDVSGPTPVPDTFEGTSNQNDHAARRNNGNDCRILCMMCQQSVRKVVFLPCGHLLFCRQCDPQIQRCGKCRSLIIQKVFIQD